MINYLKDVRAEMKHVSWPSRRMIAVYTAVVVGVSLATAVYLGIFDFIFAEIIKTVI